MEIPRLILPKDFQKPRVLSEVEKAIGKLGLEIESSDLEKPWGAYYVIADKNHQHFLDLFFPELKEELAIAGLPISAKILIAQPGGLASDQYHERRKEAWKVWSGPIEVHLIDSDTGRITVQALNDREGIRMEVLQRHRLGGVKRNWGVVAETWIHTDPSKPSNEEDIERVDDIYGRASK